MPKHDKKAERSTLRTKATNRSSSTMAMFPRDILVKILVHQYTSTPVSFLSPHEEPHSSRGQIRYCSLALLLTCAWVVVTWYFVARALRGYRNSHHFPKQGVCALAVVIRVLLWTTVSLSPVQVMVVGLTFLFERHKNRET